METMYFHLQRIIRIVAGGLFIYLFLLISFPGKSQTIDVIDLPSGNDGSSMAFDVITANGYIFIYTATGIKIYQQSDNNYQETINFQNKNYGKYNPVFFNSRLNFGAAKLMALNENSEIIYFLCPDLKIKGISTFSPFSAYTYFDPYLEPPAGFEGLPVYFAPLHHASVLKYDRFHNRLYWLIYGRSPSNCTGNFHSASRYFAIFDVIPSNGELDYYYTELVDDSGDYYDKNISDIVFNSNLQNNFYYLSKLNKIEVWEIIGNNQVEKKATVDVDNSIYKPLPSGSPGFYKFGKMIYVNNSDVHQIIALPYRFPNSELELGKDPLVYILDGNWDGSGNIPNTTIIAPSEKVSDGVVIQNVQGENTHNDLIFSYAPDPNEHLQYEDTDVTIFRYSVASGVYSYFQDIDTDSSKKISDYDINTSFKLLPYEFNGINSILIGKKDEVAKIDYHATDNEYVLQQPELEAESNFFRFGISNINKQYFINSVSNGLEVFTNGEHSPGIPLGYPVYNITGNSDGSKLYFFNTLQAQNTGLYIYDQNSGQSVNINHDGFSDNNIEKSIGDCVFNPFMNHFLVSEYGDFDPSPAVIRVIDGATNAHVQDIGLVFGNVNAQYPREIFISPEGKLYVMVNMHRDDQTAPPKIFELSAFDNGTGTAYSLLNAYDVNMPFSSGEEFDCYSAHFCYNSFNQTVYVTVHLTELALDPYNTVVNSMFNFAPPTDVYFPNGKFIGIKNGQKPTDIPLFYPGKVICPGTEYPQIPTVFNKKMYIIGKQFYEFDPVVNAYQVLITETFNDITYSPYHDKMFAIKDTFTIDCTNQRICEIYSIDNVDDEINYTLLESFPGQFSGITYNPYDSKVYLYRKTDDAKLGDTPVQIIWFDPGADPIEFITVDCPFRGSHPEYDHDPDHHYYFYNISKPYIDPVNKFIYFPNGAHSSVTRMEFEADETVPLDPSRLTWMSFPRLNRTPQNPTVNDVLGGENIDPSNYEENSYLQTLPPDQPFLVANTYTGTYWPSVTLLSEIDSRQGYKLQLEYDPENLPDKEWIHLFGEVLPAATEVQVYRQYDNWTGYWLYEKQSPFDAFPSPALDELRSIIHQNWVCAKYGYENPPDGQEPPYYWLCGCHKGKVQLSYGDMVILKTHDGNGTFNFQWQRYGNPIGGKERPEAEYFSYTEQAEYTPYLVELDTTQLPSEIGAFVNDTCVGATTVMEGDTLVLVPGYVDGMNGEVSFELYYDSLKTGRKAHTDYLVRNPETSRWDRRVIHTGEKRDVFLISLKEKQQGQAKLLLMK